MVDFLKSFDRYQLGARVAPGVLCAFPLVLMVLMARNSAVFAGIVSGMWSWVTMAGVQGLIVIGAIQSLSSMGKRYEDRIFDKGLKMPTTECLLWSNKESSDQLKRKVRSNLKTDFGIVLPSRESELADEHTARVAIRDAVARIRLRVGKGTWVRERNIRYGFVRNLAAGARLSLTLSIVGIGFAAWMRSPTYLALFVAMLVVYAVAVKTGRRSIVCNGEHYADQLLNEYAETGGKAR